jgi:hypothetical protein
LDDSKIPIIEFFMQNKDSPDDCDAQSTSAGDRTSGYKKRLGSKILKELLTARGYHLMEMGIVWKDAICVESQGSDTRAAILVDCEETSPQEWSAGFKQQKAIERVGWKCLRVDALSIVVNYVSVLENVVKFLSSIGIDEVKPSIEGDESDSERNEDVDLDELTKMNAASKNKEPEVIEIDDDDDDEVVPISSGEDESDDRKLAAVDKTRPDTSRSSLDFGADDSMEASKFGEVVDLNFLIERKESDDNEDLDPDETDDNDEDLSPTIQKSSPPRAMKYRRSNDGGKNNSSPKKRSSYEEEDEDDDIIDVAGHSSNLNENVAGMNAETVDTSSQGSQGSKRQKRRRLDKYSRDGRYYPRNDNDIHDDTVMYDTDSDLPRETRRGDDEDEDYEEGEGEELDDGVEEE